MTVLQLFANGAKPLEFEFHIEEISRFRHSKLKRRYFEQLAAQNQQKMSKSQSKRVSIDYSLCSGSFLLIHNVTYFYR